MSVIVRLQNLPWSAVAADIRQFFAGLSIPEGGVNIVGGEMGDAFIAFSTDEDARLAMQRDGGKVKECKVKLLLSSRTEMQRETARQQSLQMQYLQMQQMQTQATPQTPSAAAAAVPQPAAAMPAFPMQQPTLTNNPAAPAVPNLQPSIPLNVQQNMYGQQEPGAQPPSITAMPGMPQMQFQQMTPFSMATPLAANSVITSIPQPANLSTPSTPLQVRNQQNIQQPPPGQMPSFQTASPQINQTYQMPMPQVNPSPVSQAITSHAPVMQTTGHHMAQQPNFQPQLQQQMNMPPNFQQPIQQMPPPGFQTQLINQPPPFQAAGAPRMSQPQQFPPSNPQANHNMPFQPSFPPNTNAPHFQMANQQGSPAPSFQSPTPQVPPPTQSSQNSFPNSRLPLLQRKPENKVNHDNSSDSKKTDRSRRSRSNSSGSSGSQAVQSREHRNRDRYPEKDRRRRNSRDYRQQRGSRRDRRERRSSRDSRRDDDSRSGRRSDNKRSTDPKQLYKDYENPNSSFKPSVVPASRSKTDANSNSKNSNSTTPTASTNLDTKTVVSSKPTEKSDNRESDTKSITSAPSYSDKSSQQKNDQMNKIESSPNNKDVSSSGLPNSNDEVSTTNLSPNSPFKANNSNKKSHGGKEYKYESSPLKRKAPNDEFNQDNTHYRNKADRDEGGRGVRRRRGFDEAPPRFGDERHNRMINDETANNPEPGFRNEQFDRFNSQFNEPNSFNFSQPPSFDWENETVPNVNCCVVLQNFPIFNGSKDVIDFFHDLSPNMSIKLQRNECGHLNAALIRFANYEDKLKGLKRNGFKLKKSVVAVQHISDREFDNADDALPPQEEANKLRLQEKLQFQIERDRKPFQCLCLEGDQGVDPVFDCENVYHEDIRVVFNQINPVELFIHYGVYVNRAFVRFENFAKASSARNLLAGLIVDFVPIRILPCSDEQFARFKEMVKKEESNKKSDNVKKAKLEPNKKGRMSRLMSPNPASFGNRLDQRKNADPRMGNRKDPKAPNSFRNEGMPEMGDIQNPVAHFNQRTLLPNPPMKQLHSSPKKRVLMSCCIIMQGLPLNVHYQDIVNFFSTISIQPKQIHVMVDNGSPTGDAFCEFNTIEEADMAVKRNNCQLGINFVHVRLVSQDELDRAVGKGLKPPQPPPQLINNPNVASPHLPPNMPPPIGGPGAPPPAQFGLPPFGGRDGGAPPSDNGFRGGMGGAFNMGRGRGFPSMPRGRGRGGFESGGRGGFEGGVRGGGRGGFESGGRGGFEGRARGGGRGGFESGGRGGFEGGVRGGGRGGFESGGRGGFEGGGIRGGRGGFESGGRGGRGGFERGVRGGRRGFERGGGRRGRGDRSFAPPPPRADSPSTHDAMNDMNEDDLLPDSKIALFGKPGCVVAAENIPFRADVNDIIDFFKNYNLVAENVIRRYNDFGQATGDARIAFATPADANEAIRLYDGTPMHKRTIRLHLVR